MENFADLFDWHTFNAETLMSDPNFRGNFSQLLNDYDVIELHESFAGTGNAGRALSLQLSALRLALARASSSELEGSQGSNQGF